MLNENAKASAAGKNAASDYHREWDALVKQLRVFIPQQEQRLAEARLRRDAALIGSYSS